MRLLLLLFCLHCVQASAETLNLTNGEWAPYQGEQLPHYGVASRIVTEAFALQGIKVIWEFHPWARSLEMVESGRRPGTALWVYSPERAKTFWLSEPVLETRYHLLHRKNTVFEWGEVSDLSQQRIVATRGYHYGAPFQQAEITGLIKVNRVTSDETAIRQVLAGRADIFPVVTLVASHVLRQHFTPEDQQELTFHPKALHQDTMHLMLSRSVPGNAERLKRFNQGLAQLKQQGKVKQYLKEQAEGFSFP